MNKLAIVARNMPKPSIYTMANLIGMSLARTSDNADRDVLTKMDIVEAYNEMAYGVYMLGNGKYDFQPSHYHFRESLKIEWKDVFFDDEVKLAKYYNLGVDVITIDFHPQMNGDDMEEGWNFSVGAQYA
jgi:hypothetical protein